MNQKKITGSLKIAARYYRLIDIIKQFQTVIGEQKIWLFSTHPEDEIAGKLIKRLVAFY